MSTESLVIELDAKTQRLDAKLRKTEKRLDELDGSVKKTDSSLAKMGSVAGVVTTALVKTTTAAIALGAAIGAMTLKAASNRKELEQFARQAKTTEESFQGLAFATKQYGINAEQIADISKDISDKLGEFSAAGAGAFQDYADVMKLTKEQAKEVVVEFQNLSSEEVIGRMVKNLEDAGATGNQVTFVLESMGNDLSKLTPLFANNAEELKKMKERFSDVNSTLQITAGQAEKLKEVSTSFDLLTTGLGNAATAISATIAPVVDDFFNDIIDVVPGATQTIIDFVNSFLDAENITSIAGVNKEIEASQEKILELNERLNNKRLRGRSYVRQSRIEEEERLVALEAQLEVLKEQESLADARQLEGGEIGGEVGGSTGISSSGTGDEIEAIANRFKEEEELLIEKLDRELVIVGGNKELRLQLEEEFLSNISDLDSQAELKKQKLAIKSYKAEEKIEKLRVGLAGRSAQTLLSNSLSTEEKLFSIIKDSSASAIEAYGLTAAAKDVATLGTLVGTPIGAKTIAWTQVAAGIVRSIPLGGSAGGGGGANASIGDVSNAPPSQEVQQESELSSLNLTAQDEDSASVLTVRFATDSGDALLDAIADGLNNNQRQGR